jgi:hypothetical protein
VGDCIIGAGGVVRGWGDIVGGVGWDGWGGVGWVGWGGVGCGGVGWVGWGGWGGVGRVGWGGVRWGGVGWQTGVNQSTLGPPMNIVDVFCLQEQ